MADAVTAALLGVVHGAVSGIQHLYQLVFSCAAAGNAKAGGDGEYLALPYQRFAFYRLAQRLCQLQGIGLATARQDDGKLLPAQAECLAQLGMVLLEQAAYAR